MTRRNAGTAGSITRLGFEIFHVVGPSLAIPITGSSLRMHALVRR